MITVLLAAAALGWLVLLLVAPYAPTWMAALTYGVGSLICHQRPERSFHVDAVQLPVCARCLGIYAGAALGAVGRFAPLPDLAWHPRYVLTLAVVPTAITLVLEWTGVWAVGNVVRGAAGLSVGLAAALVLVPRYGRLR